jgi:alkyl sulfatase BDS1-like metallo-beta-lactamase superfamily hydrolase
MATGSAVRCRHRSSTWRATPKPATRAANAVMAAGLPFADNRRLRGGAPRPGRAGAGGVVVRSDSGTVLWNLGEYAFIDGELAPATVNPSLWRMARLNLANGLFKVTDRLYQLRGFDIANLTGSRATRA